MFAAEGNLPGEPRRWLLVLSIRPAANMRGWTKLLRSRLRMLHRQQVPPRRSPAEAKTGGESYRGEDGEPRSLRIRGQSFSGRSHKAKAASPVEIQSKPASR